MKIEKKLLAEVVSKARIAVRAAAPIFLLRMMRVGICESGVDAFGSDIDIGIRAVSGKIDGAVYCCVNAAVFGDVLASMDDKEVGVELDEREMVLTGARSEFRLTTADASDYPDPPDYNPERPSANLLGAFREVGFAAAGDGTRNLDAVYFDAENGFAAATDGFRLAVKTFEFPTGIIVPLRALQMLNGILEPDAPVGFETVGGSIVFESGNVLLRAQLYDYKYPDYTRILQYDLADYAEHRVDRRVMMRALRRCAIFGEAVLLEAGPGEIILTASGDNGSVSDVINSDGDSKFCVRANAKYLIDAIEAAPGDDIIIRSAGFRAPIRLIAPAWQAAVMPVVYNEDLEGKDEQ